MAAKNPIETPSKLPPKTSDNQCSPKETRVKAIKNPKPSRLNIKKYLTKELIFEVKVRQIKVVMIKIVLVICPEG